MEIFVDKKSGRIDAPFFTLLTVETVKLPDTVPDGMTVAILTPAGETLAMGHASGGSVVLDSNTLQAAGYFGDTPVGTSKNAFIVIGETDSLLAIIPVLVRANPLDMLAPPSAMAPAYPTTAELNKILAQVQAAAREATEAARTVAEDTVEALRSELEKTLGQFNAVAGQIESNKAVIVDYVDNKLPAAANKIAQDIAAAANAASTALDNKVSTASTALDGKVTAANNAATAAGGSAKAAKKARDDAESFKGNAAESAKNAATSAEQAEQAKTAIGDVGGRLDALEKPFIDPYFLESYDYNTYDWIARVCSEVLGVHDGWITYSQYNTNNDYYISSTGNVTAIPAFLNRVYRNRFVAMIKDKHSAKTQIFNTINGEKVKVTISGIGDNVTITREVLTAYPQEAFDGYLNVAGITLKNGVTVCNGGYILGKELEHLGTLNIRDLFIGDYSAQIRSVVELSDNTVLYYDNGTKKSTQALIDENGIVVEMSATGYAYSAQGENNFYIPSFSSKGLYYKYGKGLISASAESVGAIYTSATVPFFRASAFFGNGYVVCRSGIFQAIGATNYFDAEYKMMAWGIFSKQNKSISLLGAEDENRNAIVVEKWTQPYNPSANQRMHIFKKK